tara:strand:- start:78 stop:713 length:636 start_codon:yes stop_codon:yes gene_type:complete
MNIEKINFEKIKKSQDHILIKPKKFNEQFLKLYQDINKIIIFGPHRSGTTFTAKALAQSFNKKFIDESDFEVRNFKLFQEKIKQDNIVVQAPGLTCCAHKLNLTKKDLIIYMHRSWVDILKSWIRVSDRDVTTEWLQKKTVERYLSHDKNFKQFLKYDDIYLNFRIQCWLKYQKPKCINAIELDYESMSNHPIWMQKESRRQFRKKQTQAL